MKKFCFKAHLGILKLWLVISVFFFLSLVLPESKVLSNQEEFVYLKVSSATASSFDDTPDWAPMPNPLAPVDGDLLTRWSSKLGLDNQWIYFDFGEVKTLSKIIIRWEAAYAKSYEISVSDDAVDWKPILVMKHQDGGTDVLEFEPVKTRYVKLTSFERSNPEWGISIWEFEPYGYASLNPTDKPIGVVFPDRGDLTLKPIIKIESPLKSPGPISEEEFHKGVVYTSWGRTELASKASDATLKYLKDLGVEHLALMIIWFQDKVDSTELGPDLKKDTPKDEALAHAINTAHSLGLKVTLKPHLDVREGDWRGGIIPSREWFSLYKDFILYYAKLAQKYNVELFCIGTELVNTTTKQWEDNWFDIIKEVKGIYKGPLVYSANWDEYQSVPFWNELDFIGIDAYFPLTEDNDPSKEELIAAWEGYANQIERWLKQKKINKPVIFTELGYSSADGTNKQPWRTFSHMSLDKVDEKEQADCLDALFMALSKRSWFKGLYWWQYFPQERWSPLGYPIKGKLAESVLKRWYKK